MQKIGFLGTGLMGRPMIERLLGAAFSVTAWNRTAAKAEPLRRLGASIAARPAAAGADADIVCVILENADAVESVLFTPGFRAVLRPGTVVVDLTSLHPDAARNNAERLAKIDVSYLDAPVSGGPSGAAEGNLAIMVGGEAGAFARAEAVLACFGRPSHVGPSGSGQITKLGSQLIAGAALAAIAEALLLFSQSGVAVDRARQALFGGFADSRILRNHGQRMIARDFAPGGHIRTFLKDLDAAADMADRAGLDFPIAAASRALFASLARQGHAEADISAMALAIEARNAGRRIATPGEARP